MGVLCGGLPTPAPPRLSQTGSCCPLSPLLHLGCLLRSSGAPAGAGPLLGQGWSCVTGCGQAWGGRGQLLLHRNRKPESGSGCLVKGFRKVSGAALEPERNASGWLVWVSISPGACILLRDHSMDPQTSPVDTMETPLAGFSISMLSLGFLLGLARWPWKLGVLVF